MVESAKRIAWIDLAKGICMLLVILGHFVEHFRAIDPSGDVNCMFSSFRMPLYFILSGLFFKTYTDFCRFAQKKINHLLIPYIVFFSLSFILKGCNFGPVWFLFSLFVVNMLCYGLLNVFKSRVWLLAVFSLVFAFVVFNIPSMRDRHPFLLWNHIRYIEAAVMAVPFFLTGYFVRQNDLLTRLDRTPNWMIALLTVINAAVMLMVCWMENWGDTSYVINEYKMSFISTYMAGLCGAMAIFMLARLLRYIPIVSYIGRYSIVVLIWHGTVINLYARIVSYLGLDACNLWSSVLAYVMVVITLLPVIWVCIRYMPYLFAQKEIPWDNVFGWLKHTKKFLIIAVISCSCINSFAQSGKISPYLRQMSHQYIQEARKVSGIERNAIERRTTAFVRTQNPSVLVDNGCRILASWDDIHIASIPLSRLNTLASSPLIQRIEANAPCHITNDTTASIVGVCASPFVGHKAKDVRNTYGLTGKGVVVGIMDVGLDLTHPNYYSRDGRTYRVKSVWDQLDWSTGGEQVKFQIVSEGSDGSQKESTYLAPGRQYTDEMSILKKACTADSLLTTHGTHTSGTAAGSGFGGGDFYCPLRWQNQYSGMAPEADICLVGNADDTNLSIIPKEHLTEYTSATDLLGFKYMFDYAESVNKPCVISFSEGTSEDMHDCQLYDEVLQKLQGPGRIICASAGNQGRKGSYICKTTGKTRAGAFLLSSSKYAYGTISSTEPSKFVLNFYKKDGGILSYNFDTASLKQYADSIVNDTISPFDSLFVVSRCVYPDCYDKNKFATEFLLTRLSGLKLGSEDLPVALILEGVGYEAEVYAPMGFFSNNSIDTSLSDFTTDHNILYPGSSSSVITVGSTAYVELRKNLYGNLVGLKDGTDGIIPEYSSKGPTMSGVIKPDVVAPGTNVISAGSSFKPDTLSQTRSWRMNESVWNGRSYPWNIDCGTSMSTPVVAGIIALWLEECPTLSPDDIREVFANTCRRGDGSLSYPNNSWGWGEIDAVAGLEYIRGHYTGIDEIENSKLKIRNCQGYDLMGRRIADSSGYRGIVIRADGSKVVR